jgi:hypothetical protein
MALFGTRRDIGTFTGISRELLENVVSQTCGYYKVSLTDTEVNVYGEGQEKYFIGPVLINCLIERGDFVFKKEDFGVDVDRPITFRFMKYHLIQANVVPEVGDAILYNESFYQVDGANENQYIVGKDNDYSYQDGLENFGDSYSIIVTTHLTSPDILGIKQNRL